MQRDKVIEMKASIGDESIREQAILQQKDDSTSSGKEADDYYYEKCPGCEIHKLKYSTPKIPLKHLILVWVITLSAGLSLPLPPSAVHS